MNEISLLVELVKQHAEEDTRRFEELNVKLDQIKAITTSLAESRTLARGAWKATATIAGLVSGLMSATIGFIAWWVK